MEKKDDLDELLYKYMPIVDEELISELEMQVDGEFTFSEEFERKMEGFIHRNKFYSQIRKLRKYIGYTAAALVVALGLCLPFSQTVRAYSGMIIERVMMALEDSFVYKYFVNNDVDDVVLREPCYIPEGFEKVNDIKNDTMYYALYEDEQGNQITYQQMLVSDEMEMAMDSEFVSEKTRSFKGYEITFYFYEDGSMHAYCLLDSYIFEITAEGTTEDDIYRMIEDSIKNFIK